MYKKQKSFGHLQSRAHVGMGRAVPGQCSRMGIHRDRGKQSWQGHHPWDQRGLLWVMVAQQQGWQGQEGFGMSVFVWSSLIARAVPCRSAVWALFGDRDEVTKIQCLPSG